MYLYFLALNLILHSKGILQQNSFSKNSEFCFLVYNFPRQSDLPPLVEVAACHFYLPCPLHALHRCSLRAADGTSPSLYGLPSAVLAISQVWQCLAGQPLRMQHSFAPQEPSGPWCSCSPLVLVSKLLLQAFMRPRCLGICTRQEEPGWSIDCSLVGQ